MRTLVFLDIDGVFNHDHWHRAQKPVRGRSRKYFEYLKASIDPVCLRLLNMITDLSGAQIVLSSSWRYKGPWEQTADGLHRLGMTGTMIGRTPKDEEIDEEVFRRYRGRLPRLDEPYPRGYEIQQWVDTQVVAPKFVILDDDDDMEHLSDRLVRTDYDRGGLQLAHAQRALNLLR